MLKSLLPNCCSSHGGQGGGLTSQHSLQASLSDSNPLLDLEVGLESGSSSLPLPGTKMGLRE